MFYSRDTPELNLKLPQALLVPALSVWCCYIDVCVCCPGSQGWWEMRDLAGVETLSSQLVVTFPNFSQGDIFLHQTEKILDKIWPKAT